MLDTTLNLLTAFFYVTASAVMLYIQRVHYSHTRFNMHRLIYIAGAGVCAMFALRFLARSPPFFYDPTLPTIEVAVMERWIGLVLAMLSLELLNFRSRVPKHLRHKIGLPFKSAKLSHEKREDNHHEAQQKQPY